MDWNDEIFLNLQNVVQNNVQNRRAQTTRKNNRNGPNIKTIKALSKTSKDPLGNITGIPSYAGPGVHILQSLTGKRPKQNILFYHTPNYPRTNKNNTVPRLNTTTPKGFLENYKRKQLSNEVRNFSKNNLINVELSELINRQRAKTRRRNSRRRNSRRST